jgi:hypothetical protein
MLQVRNAACNGAHRRRTIGAGIAGAAVELALRRSGSGCQRSRQSRLASRAAPASCATPRAEMRQTRRRLRLWRLLPCVQHPGLPNHVCSGRRSHRGLGARPHPVVAIVPGLS